MPCNVSRQRDGQVQVLSDEFQITVDPLVCSLHPSVLLLGSDVDGSFQHGKDVILRMCVRLTVLVENGKGFGLELKREKFARFLSVENQSPVHDVGITYVQNIGKIDAA